MLVTEGTYPQVHGGVSTWCDQMIRGLNKHRFHVVSLTATGREEVVWDLPGNVLDHVTVPIWTMVPATRRQVVREGEGQASEGRSGFGLGFGFGFDLGFVRGRGWSKTEDGSLGLCPGEEK